MHKTNFTALALLGLGCLSGAARAATPPKRALSWEPS